MNTKAKEKTMEIVGKIIFVSKDRRHRVLLEDEVRWLEKKMREIKKLAQALKKLIDGG